MTPERPDVASEPDYWYQDKLTGQRVAFSPKTGEAVVTLAGTLDRDTLPGLLSGPAVRSISRGANLRRGFAAVHVEPGRAVSDLTAQEDVASALPVMIDQDGLERYFLPSEFTVQFRPEVNAATAAAIISRLGSDIVARQRTPGYYTLLVPHGRGLFATIRQFSDLPEVAFAEPSEAGFDDALAHIPADPDFPRLWGMRNTGQAVNGVAGTAGIDIDASAAWDLHRGDPAVIVTVIDTGADLDHPDLQANLLPRGGEDWDFADAGDRARTTRRDTAPMSPAPPRRPRTRSESSASLPAARSCPCASTCRPG
jgi:subtilisin family serine protease